MLTKGASAIIGITGLLLTTRYLGAEQYGTITWMLAILATFNTIADLGFGSAHIKRVSEGHDLNECVSTFAYVKALLTLAMALFVVFSMGIWYVASEHPISVPSIRILLVLLVYQVVSDLTTIATTTFDAKVQTAKSQLVYFCDPLVRLPFLVFVLLNGMGASGVSFAYLAGGIGASVVALFLIAREGIVWQKPKLIHSYAKWAIPMVAVMVASGILLQLAPTMIGFFWPKSDVAYFSSSVSLLSYLGILGSSAMMLLFPTFSKWFHESRVDDIKRASREGERYLSLISLPILTTIIVFPSQIAVIMFGDAFYNTGRVLPYLAVATYIGLLNITVSAQVLGMSRTDLYLKWTYVDLILATALLIILVPSSVLGIHALGLSYRGAAIARVISAFVGYGIARWLTYILIKARPNPSILKHVVAAATIGIVMFYASTVYPVVQWYDAAIYLLIALGGFLSILYCLREFTAHDLRFFLDALDVNKLMKYVRGELWAKGKEPP
jgi:O-antigen/teichoic acid export membrane protein